MRPITGKELCRLLALYLNLARYVRCCSWYLLTANSTCNRLGSGQAHSLSLALRTRIRRLRSKSKANPQKSAHNAVAKSE